MATDDEVRAFNNLRDKLAETQADLRVWIARAEKAEADIARVREELDHWEWDALGNSPVVQVDAIRAALDEPEP